MADFCDGESIEVVRILEENDLAKHTETLMDPNGNIGLRSLQDLCDLCGGDIEEIVKAAGLNIGEKFRFVRLISKLQGERHSEIEATKMTRCSTNEVDSLLEPVQPSQLAYDDPLLEMEYSPGSEWYFDVVKSMVFVRSAPRKDSLGIGILRNGMQIQVIPRKIIDDSGGVWVELTKGEIFRSCEPELEPMRGFALIDGTHIGLDVLLQGPVRKAGIQCEDESTMLIQAGQERERRQIEDGNYIVTENMRLQVENRTQHKDEEHQTLADALTRARRDAERKEQRRQEMTALCKAQKHFVKDSVPFLAVGNYVHMTLYVLSHKVKKMECKPGTVFYLHDLTAVREQSGALWMERASTNTFEGSHWLLVEDSIKHSKFLLHQSEAQNHAIISIDYIAQSQRNDIRVFEVLIDVQSSVQTLNTLLCEETGLKPKSTFLFSTRPPVSGMPQKQDIMQATRSLQSYGIEPGTDVQVYLGYPFSFEKDYCGGVFLEVLE